jgi:hypothetical protein
VVRRGGHEEIHKATQALDVLLWRVRLAFSGHARERARRIVVGQIHRRSFLRFSVPICLARFTRVQVRELVGG